MHVSHTPILQCQNIGFRYEASQSVFNNIQLTLDNHEFLSIMGKSGCGKSTLLRCMAGLLRPQEGELRWNTPTSNITFMYQRPLLFPWLNIEANLLLPLRFSPEGAKSKPNELLELVGLSHRRYAYPYELSGGERRRASLARSLIAGRPILFLDEPFAGVDEITREQLCELLKSIIEASRVTCILVTHSAYEAALLSDRVLIMGGINNSIQCTIDFHARKSSLPASPHDDVQYRERMIRTALNEYL